MPSSGSKINYYLRTSKCIERKMICEAFRRLSEFRSMNKYKYIGFGSFYFTDFILFHKDLGINNMISIESKVTEKERFNFNKPLKSIKIEFGTSTDVLPRLEWPKLRGTITWLDYDQRFEPYMLDDIFFLSSKITSGSIFLITCNRSMDEKNSNPVEKFKESFGLKSPLEINEEDLYSSRSHFIIKRMIDQEIERALNERNSGQDEVDKYIYQQLFFFTYRDSAPMITIGGIIIQKKDSEKLKKCKFNHCEYISIGNSPFSIDVPSLTYKEITMINKKLPSRDITNITIPGVSSKDIEKYVKLYRYFPYYMEVQIFN